MRQPDFFGPVSLSGLDKAFSDTGTGYQVAYKNQESRAIIPANEAVTLKAYFRRTAFQRFMLTAGQLLLALIVGAVLGFVATMSEKNPMRWIIQTIGILVLPLSFRAVVFATYKDLPTFWIGQQLTIFEILFVVSIALFIASSLVVASQRQKRRAKAEARVVTG